MWRQDLATFALWAFAVATLAVGAYAIGSSLVSDGGHASRDGERGVQEAAPPEPPARRDDAAAPPASTPAERAQESPFAPDDAATARDVELVVLRALDGEVVGASGKLGAPGVFPPVEWIAPDDAPARVRHEAVGDMKGEPVRTLEVIARSRHQGEDLAFWGEVDPRAEGHYELGLESASPLRVEVVTPEGAPAEGARVRISRGVVGLVSEWGEADGQGVVEFEPLPAGEYTLVVERRGALRQTARVGHELTEEPVNQVVVLERDRAVFGAVLDARGRPVVDALVEVHVDPVLREDVLLTSLVSQVYSAPPSGATFTDAQGLYVIDGLKKGTAFVVARGGMGAVGMSGAIDLFEVTDAGPVDVRLMGGVDVVVTVVAPSGEGVSGAQVEWRDEVTGAGRVDRADASGVVVLEQVPVTARIVASTKGWSSAAVRPGQPDEDGLVTMRLELSPKDARGDWRVRVTPPLGYAFDALELVRQVEGDTTERCEVTHEKEHVYKVTRCAQGDAWLVATTRDHGVHRSFERLSEGSEVVVGAPREARVTFGGREPVALERARLRWREEGGRWRAAAHEPTTLERTRRFWTHELFAGVYELELELDGERWERTLSVGEEGAALEWEIPVTREVEVLVADRLGNALRGAHVEVWSGGELVGEGVSPGRAPVRVRYEGAPEVRVIASHWREGEGEVRGRAGGEIVVRLDGALLGVKGADRITDRAELERALGARLVDDAGALLVDVLDRESPAARAGIPRAARLVRARRRSWGVEVLFEVAGEEGARVARVGAEDQRR